MIDNPEVVYDVGIDKLISRVLDIFWAGIIIYVASFALSTTTTVNYIVCQIFQIFGIILFLPTAIILINWRFDNFYLKLLFSIYCLWLLIVVFRGFVFSYSSMKFMLFDAEFGLLRYFAPLILLFPQKIIYYKKLFSVVSIFGIIFIFYSLLFRNNLLDLNYTNNNTKFTFEYFAKNLSMPAGFILLTYAYHTKRNKLFAFFVVLITIGFAVFRARRSLIFMSATPLILTYYLYLTTEKKKLLVIISSAFIIPFMIYFGVRYYSENKYGTFGLLTQRISEDTRTGVEEHFYQDMNTRDWIIGKGINGLYYCPNIDLGNFTGYRSMIETDYLNIILKGGLISLGLLLLITIPAIFLGLFYSENLLSKAAGFWILIWLISLYPATVNTFSLNHLLMWISVGICYSKELRNYSDIEIKRVLFKKLTGTIIIN